MPHFYSDTMDRMFNGEKMIDFDKTIRPQDDFFSYVNNNWLKNNPIPNDEKWWGHFGVLRDNSSKAINEIVNDILKTKPSDCNHNQNLLKSFFESGNNYSKNRLNHLKTLEKEIQKVRNISDKKQISGYLGYAHRSIGSFWESFVSIDDKDSNNQLLFFSQSGLTLPNRDYYLDKSADMRKIRNNYEEHLFAMKLKLPDYLPENTKPIIEIETILAKASWTEAMLRNTQKNYNKFKISEIRIKYSSFNWDEYFESLGWENPKDDVIIGQPLFISKCLEIMDTFCLDDIKNYLCWKVFNHYNQFIDEDLSKLKFDFFGKIIDGKKEMQPLWKRIVNMSDRLVIGEALGQEYAKRHFPESSKAEVLKIVNDITTAYHSRIDEASWMSQKTKKVAHKKLDNIKVLIGYPSAWKDLSKLNYLNNNYLNNIIATEQFMHQIDIDKIGKKPSEEDWHMNAHTVNAYFSPSRLEICFPAGILQPPFFDANASYATNLGGIGSVIGHELTHGFDDQGAEYDELGNLRNWQTKSEQKAFKDLSKNLIEQANEYEILPNIFMKGDLVLGEAIADIGGIVLAIEALKTNTQPNHIDYSLKELFIGYAVTECSAERDECLVQSAKTDPHPPGKFRVNNTFKNIDEFYSAYNLNNSDKLYIAPDERVRIW